MILYGTVTGSRQGRDANGKVLDDPNGGSSDFVIEQVIKTHPILNGRKQLELPRYIPPDPQGRNGYLIFFDVFKGQADPYKGLIASPAIVDYLRPMLALRPEDQRGVLAHAFRHLEHADAEIARDAFLEFFNADYKDYRTLAPTLRPDRLAYWLQDPQMPVARRGVYALLLGHCGSEQDARLLRRLLDDPENEGKGIYDHILVGYTVLRPREGWRCVSAIVKDSQRSFVARYACLRAVRFFWDERPALVTRGELLAAVERLLDQEDIADLAIEDLRRRARWEATGRILALQEKESHWQSPLIRRAVLRFALCCPLPEAASFVEQMRQADPEKFRDTEELLRLEADADVLPKPAATS